jgi:hypothetical protein
MIRSMRWRAAGRIALAALLGAALVVILFGAEHARAGGGRLVHSEWARFWLWLLPLGVLLFRLRRGFPAGVGNRTLTPGLVLLGFAALYLVSGTALHPWFFFLRWAPESWRDVAHADAGLVRCVLLTGLLTPFMLRPPRRLAAWLLLLLLATQALCIAALWRGTGGGAALYRDDRPSFMFRIWEYAQTFPRLVTYNPYWNGGVVNFVGTTSGTGAIALPLLPLWRWAPVEAVYTPAIVLLYAGVLPWLAVWAVRLVGGSRAAACAAGLLMAGVSRHFFLWALHFGTVGAVFSAAFLLPFAGALYRIVQRRDTRARCVAALVVSALMLLQWPPGALMGATAGFGVLLSARRWRRRTWGALAAAAAVVLLVYLRPLLVIGLKGDALMCHVMDDAAVRFNGVMVVQWLARGWNCMAAHMLEAHPLLLFLGVGGIAVLPYRSLRRWVAPMLIGLALLAGWITDLRPNMQLSRMAIPFCYAAVIPAALWAGRLLGSGGALLAPARAFLLALLALGGLNVARFYGNAGHAPYTALDNDVRAFASWVRREVPPGGRLLFAGRCVHYFGRGHVAFLPGLTGREMMACDYYAFPPGTIEYQYPPSGFRRPRERLLRFFELYNVTHVATYHDNWKEALREHPESFEEQTVDTSWDRMAVFRVLRENTPLLQGKGRVTAAFNRLDVALDDAEQVAVLPYNWADRLRAPEPVELFPYEAEPDVTLIGVRPHGQNAFTIRFGGWL